MGTAAIRSVKRLAASVLKVGVTRVRIKPDALDRVETAITREDVKRLIKDGVIYKIPPLTPSRGRWRKVRAQRKKRRGRGPGSRKGPHTDEKRVWVAHVRAQRRFLRTLKEKGLIDSLTYRHVRALIKGGMFTSVRHLKTYLKEEGILTKG